MPTIERSWRTWAASRTDLVRAVREAGDALAQWGAYPAAVKSNVTYGNELSETLDGVDGIEGIFISDLRGLRSIWIEVSPDRDAYEAERDRLRKEHYEERQRRIDAYAAERTRLREVWEAALKERIGSSEPLGSPEQPEEPEEVVGPHEPPPLISASVLLRIPFGGSGLRIEVRGPDRHQVTGLLSRLEEILTRRQSFRRLDPDGLCMG